MFLNYVNRIRQELIPGGNMSAEMIPTEDKKVNVKVQGGSDTVYALGFIGACVYYIRRGQTTEEKVKGFFKAVVWPAFMVYEIFKFLEK
jgi:hypothetical protein